MQKNGRGKGHMGGRGGASGFSHIDANANAAAEYYVSGDRMWINQYLRRRINDDGFRFTEQDKEYLRDLDRATSTPLTKNENLFRSVDAAAVFRQLSAVDYENMVAGLVYGDSSSLRRINSLVNSAKGKTITEKVL